MADRSSVAVALLYETRERGEHLRDTLAILGAPIVYEAAASALDLDALARSQARVVIVNLDAGNDPALDEVYGLLDDARYRVVFNEGEVSSELSGWDHARWVRHLSAKIFGEGDIDPPRPADASPVPAPAPRAVSSTAGPAVPAHEPASLPPAGIAAAQVQVPDEPAPFAQVTDSSFAPVDALAFEPVSTEPPVAAEPGAEGPVDADTAAFDLDRLLDDPLFASPAPAAAHPHGMAADAQGDAGVVSEAGLASTDFDNLFDEPLPLPPPPVLATTEPVASPDEPDGGEFADIEALLASLSSDAAEEAPLSPALPTEADAPAVPDVVGLDLDFDLDDLVGEGADALPADAPPVRTGDVPALPAAVVAAPELPPEPVSAPISWSLASLDDQDGAPAPPPLPVAGKATPADFGIEKVSAQEYLAPAAPAHASLAEEASSELTLELIPLEEAVAPTAIEKTLHETWLDPDSRTQVRRVWVLGASIGGPESVREFLARLPRNYPALFVLAQHLGDEFVEMMAQQLARATPLTVRTPTHGERVGHGEIVVVPNGQRMTIDAEGVVVLARDEGAGPYRPSIDRVLTDFADRYGAGAGAIVFSGMGSDALEGCRHVAARGGRIYVQSPDSCVVSTMVDGVVDAGLVTFQGTPAELAERLQADIR